MEPEVSLVRCTQSTPSLPISLTSILVLSFHLHMSLPSGLFPSDFPTKILFSFLILSHACYLSFPSHPWFDLSNNIWWRVQIGTVIAQWYGLWTGWLDVQVSAGAENFPFHHCIQTGSGAHPASYPMGTRDSLPVGNATGKWSWPLTSI